MSYGRHYRGNLDDVFQTLHSMFKFLSPKFRMLATVFIQQIADLKTKTSGYKQTTKATSMFSTVKSRRKTYLIQESTQQPIKFQYFHCTHYLSRYHMMEIISVVISIYIYPFLLPK
jgi:hypothetical protein